MGVSDESGKLRGSALIIKQDLPFNLCWIYCPRGPLTSFNTPIAEFLFKEIDKIAKSENAVFLRIDPGIEDDPNLSWKDIFPEFRLAHDEYQPRHTLKIDLNLSEEEILAQMKQKGRYNIRLAEKHGVKVVRVKLTDKPNFDKSVDEFYEILKETTGRDGFSGHDKNYYKNMLEILGEKNFAQMYLAQFEGKTIAGIIVTFFGDTAIYYFGASSNEYRNLMAPYLLQWEAIKDAKKRDLKWYDFLGIAPEDDENHPWKGVTQFKKQFGGKVVNYMPALEKVYKKGWYWGMVGRKRMRN
ncbi:MAG: Methicillin resistance protein [Candidatus Peregrinibacteria bacterium GW2011_GWA2_33_10]|nr:MAG: Methicillin resistance protein [Candidatus Peregrinibacteria bacterium GW2011_GWA2_33_10]